MKTLSLFVILSASAVLASVSAFAGGISCFVDDEPSCRTKVLVQYLPGPGATLDKIVIDNEACPLNTKPTLTGEFQPVTALRTDGVLGTYAGRSQDQKTSVVLNLNKSTGTDTYSGTLVYFGDDTQIRTLTCATTE